VLQLTERRFCLDEMTLEASVESSRTTSAALSTDELLWWVMGMVGKVDYTAVISMRPDQGYVSLVSFWFLLLLLFLPFSSYTFHPFRRGCGLWNHPTLGSRGRGWLGGALVGRRGEEEERCRQEVGLQENAGPRRIGETPKGTGKGGVATAVLS
jgi:hypothetical protein